MSYLTILGASLLLISCHGPSLSTHTGKTMGTTYTVKIWDGPQDYDSTQKKIDEILFNIDKKMSTYKSDSEISLFNKLNSTQWFRFSNETLGVLKKAQDVYLKSQGSFDITVFPLVLAWGFGSKARPNRIPSQNKLKELMKSLGQDKLEYSQGKVRKTQKSLTLDLSAIAKGHAVDAIADYLRKNKITNFLVEVGGEILANGHNNGSHWRVAIESPVPFQISNVVNLTKGLATSGSYRNYYEENGKRYSHMIDPSTGSPISHNLVSVSVLHDRCAYADAWATAFMILGAEKSYKLAIKLKIDAYFIIKKNSKFQVLTTPGFPSHMAPAKL